MNKDKREQTVKRLPQILKEVHIRDLIGGDEL